MTLDEYHALMETICRQFGLDPRIVARLELEPRHALATVYVLNDAGQKHIADNGEPATTQHAYDWPYESPT